MAREGWTNVGGGSHDNFSNAARPGELIIVPRHREVSPGVAKDIAKRAGWS
jgi:predicted RNA binding protein YcfA (HicA-like mRNA interferase family)